MHEMTAAGLDTAQRRCHDAQQLHRQWSMFKH